MQMRTGRLLLRLGTLAGSLLTAGILLLGPAAAPAGALSPVSHLVTWLDRMPREVVVQGHCQIVDGGGTPITDPLSWQRTGHDPC
jgi:hypothetical protein